jgi:hypothetical protein
MWAPKSTRQIHGVDLHVFMGEGGAQNLAKRSKTLFAWKTDLAINVSRAEIKAEQERE